MPKLTKRLIDSLKPTEQEYAVWDDELKGFGIRVSPKGNKTFQVYWRAGKRERKRKVGRYPPMTVDQARKAAFELLSDVENGNDPAVKQDLLRKAETMTELGNRFLIEHSIPHNKEKTVYENRHLLDRFIFPALGKVKAVDVAKSDVRRLHQSLKDTPYQANRVLALLSKIFNFTADDLYEIRHDWRNPTDRLQKFKEEKRKRYLSQQELQIISKAMHIAERENIGTPHALAALRLLIFTGARKSEILSLKWDYINWDRRCFALPDSKTGAKDIPLSPPALEVLNNIEKLKDNPYAIVGKNPQTHMDDLGPTWRRIRNLTTILMLEEDEIWGPVIEKIKQENNTRPSLQTVKRIADQKGYTLPTGIADVRVHDLRHSFASIAVGAGIPLPLIGGLLGHTQTQTTARYAHLEAEPLHQATNTIGRHLQAAMADDETSAEIIRFSKQ
ncbi:tyrosine-type recombinase/integrase [Terasakiella sp.]|uniref:tyrosine-type recombinase/integrase n=1 Tax=Terasakiella sp. TaxID=2034861 RepID=UPI003AA8B7E9